MLISFAEGDQRVEQIDACGEVTLTVDRARLYCVPCDSGNRWPSWLGCTVGRWDSDRARIATMGAALAIGERVVRWQDG